MDKALYNLNKMRFIMCLRGAGRLCCEVWTCAYTHNLTMRGYYWYPGFNEWYRAACDCLGYDVGSDFGRMVLDLVDDDFYRLFTRWEYTLAHFNRYMMQHEAVYGRKEMWKEEIFK